MSIQPNKKKSTSSSSDGGVAVPSKIPIYNKPFTLKGFSVLIILFFALFPVTYAYAGFFSSIGQFFGMGAQAAEAPENETTNNSQNLPLMESTLTPELKSSTNTVDVTIVDDQALESKNGPLGTEVNFQNFIPSDTKIDVYMVKNGDTLDSIAKTNKVSKAAIIYANNDIKRSDLTKVGQMLVISPLKGAMYTVKKGETAQIIAKRYGLSVGDITEYNVLPKASDLKAGDSIILVGLDSNAIARADKQEKDKKNKQIAEKETPTVQIPSKPIPTQIEKPEPSPTTEAKESKLDTGTGPSGNIRKGYIWPFPAGVGSVSQGLHDDRAMDLRAPKGTPIYAVASGDILIAHPTGWNGGYGLYVVMNFDNGAQAIYGHMSKVTAVQGTHVNQGDIIGYVGSTGKSTGPHLHLGFHGGFENPFEDLKVRNTDADFHD
ncbi:peptidoglycan DD-metalloendopeptidase family protein [Candidatus Nomurabacteria bacterium]|nr:peptidoglycan DD-metalloendopeptidase family protein [Candidatus Nomurabacteria bacterium]